MTVKEFGKRVKDTRESKQMSQDTLARLCGYTSRTTICKIEAGIQGVPLKKVDTIAQALNVSKDFLLWGREVENIVIEAETVRPSAKGKKAVLMSWINEMSDEDVDKLLNVIELFFKKEE